MTTSGIDLDATLTDQSDPALEHLMQWALWASALFLTLFCLLIVGTVALRASRGFGTYLPVSDNNWSAADEPPTESAIEAQKANPPQEHPSPRETRLRWSRTRTQHRAALGRIAAYELEPVKAIDFPAFNDLAVPEVKGMIAQLRTVEDIAATTQADRAVGGSTELLERYEYAARELHLAIDLAERAAHRIRWNHLSADDREDLQTVKDLLHHASDPGTPEPARTSYYQQIQRIVARLNTRHGAAVIPRQAAHELTSTTRRALSA